MLLMYDSFDHYLYADMTQKWNQIITGNNDTSTITSVGRRGTNGLRLSHNQNIGVNRWSSRYLVLPQYPFPSGDTVIFGFSFRNVLPPAQLAISTNSEDGTCNVIWSVMQSSTVLCWCRQNNDGTLSVYQGTNLLGTTLIPLLQNVEYFLQGKVKMSTTVGTVELRIDLNTALALTGVNTGGAAWNQFRLGWNANSNAAGDWNIDDFYLCDNYNNGDGWNDFRGDIRLDVRRAVSDGANVAWVPSSGSSRAAMINEQYADGDTTYITASGAGEKVSCVWEDAAAVGADIFGVQIVMQSRKTDSGTAGQKSLVRIGGTDYLGTELSVSSSYSMLRQVYGVSPATGIAWTEAEFNAAEFGCQKST